MKRLTITKKHIIIGIAICSILYVAVILINTSRPKDYFFQSDMTAEETVQEYFNCWNEKNVTGMHALRIASRSSPFNTDWRDLLELNSVELTDLQKIEDIRACKGVFPDAYDWDYYRAYFDIKFYFGSSGSMESGSTMLMLKLIKETKDSDWVIVSMGNG